MYILHSDQFSLCIKLINRGLMLMTLPSRRVLLIDILQNHFWMSYSVTGRRGLPWWLSGKESAYNAGGPGDMGLISGLGRSPGRGQDNPLHYSCLENPMDRGVWWATVHSVSKSQTWLKRLSMHTCSVTEVHSELMCTYPDSSFKNKEIFLFDDPHKAIEVSWEEEAIMTKWVS